jgi:hypothetical protein
MGLGADVTCLHVADAVIERDGVVLVVSDNHGSLTGFHLLQRQSRVAANRSGEAGQGLQERNHQDGQFEQSGFIA